MAKDDRDTVLGPKSQPKAAHATMKSSSSVHLIRVFVSSPKDVHDARSLLKEVVDSVNRTDGAAGKFRLELWMWEDNVIPRSGPQPQQVIDDQTPPYDVYLGIMSTRFGTPTGKHGSGTEAEFRAALKMWQNNGKPWISFYFDDTPQVGSTPQEAEQYLKVCKFRGELAKLGIVANYKGIRGSANSFYEKVAEHLREIARDLTRPRQRDKRPQRSTSPATYLAELDSKTAFIDIRGLQVGKAKASRFPIEDLFITLTTAHDAGRSERVAGRWPHRRQTAAPNNKIDRRQLAPVPLERALTHDRLVIIGDPGGGKTTFLRRVAHALCQTASGTAPNAARQLLGVRDRTFPILIRINELAQYLVRQKADPRAPAGDDAPGWLPHYLAALGASNGWNLDSQFFRRQLEAGRCTVLLDGLDETSDRIIRKRIARLVESAADAYRDCRFVVTSRPAAYEGEAVLPGFAEARIDPLSESAVATFLSRWCEAVYAESPRAAEDHCDELLSAVRSRSEIRRMARNPVMLTALAVVHWNEQRLPEQRAALYESILKWLSRSREQRPERASAEETLNVLQELALAMQDEPRGRRVQVPKRWAAEKIAQVLTPGRFTKESVARAEQFLDEEELDSGIIVGRGDELAFWHLTFAEFLAARAIAGRLENEQTRILFRDPAKLHSAEWREVVLLLAGILCRQGKDKVNWFVTQLLDRSVKSRDLAAKALCAGLMGNLLRDLEPLKYEVSDPRYSNLLRAVQAIFERGQSRAVPMKSRIAVGDALGQADDLRLDIRRDAYWVTIPASKFWMGAQSKNPKKPNYDKEADEDESPVHEVNLAEYSIARYPVTVGQYRRFVEDEGYETERWWNGGGFARFSEPEDWDEQILYPARPVVGVSWFEAAAFCAWAGYRLPTEAEWERAARGANGRRFPWGDTTPTDNSLNFDGKVGEPTPVGIFPEGNTPEEISDLAGNVDEWCADWYAKYPAKSMLNPSDAKTGVLRVLRGGSWIYPAEGCRSAYRNRSEPAYRYEDLGFRVARSPSGQSSPVQSSSSVSGAGSVVRGAAPRAQRADAVR